jgi:vacuolar-type H+-ATPase subunit I/STV1
MKRTLSCSFSIITAVILVASTGTSIAQDSTNTFKTAELLMSDVLNLNDPVLSIWPNVNDLEIESLSAAVQNLTEAYESDRLDADLRTREIQSMVADAKSDEVSLKEMISVTKDLIKAAKKVAKDAEDGAKASEEAKVKELEGQKDDLEKAKKFYEERRKYLERVTKIRDGERKVAETRIDYVNQLAYVLDIAKDLVDARETEDTDARLATEREMIRQSTELGLRLSAVASNIKKANSEREKAFKEREKLIAAYH